MARAMVTTAGRLSGMAPTARAMAKVTVPRRASKKAAPLPIISRAVPTASISAERATIPTVSLPPISWSARVSGVTRSVASASMVEIRPNSVAAPVPTTTPVPVP